MSVIDVQCHWYPREFFETLAGRSGYPRAEKNGDGYTLLLSEHASAPITPRFFDLDLQMEQATALGIDVLLSSTGSLSIDGLPLGEARELATQLNEARAKAQTAYPDRYIGLATLPLGDPTAAIETLDDACGRLGLAGVCMCSNRAGEPVVTEELRPLFARINALGVPLFLHPTWSVMADKLDRYGLDLSVGFMFDTTIAVLDLVFTGILQELADVPVVHPHFGATVPALAGRIDYQSARMPAAQLDRPPSEYLRTFYTDTVSSADSHTVQAAVDFYGADRIMYASDFPFWDWDDSFRVVDENFTGDARDAVLGGTASRILGLTD